MNYERNYSLLFTIMQVFEDFINSTSEDLETDDKIEEESDEIQEIQISDKDEDKEKGKVEENQKDDKDKEEESGGKNQSTVKTTAGAAGEVTQDTDSPAEKVATEKRDQWMWLLVRSNSKDELMLFAAGRAIAGDTMEKLKKLFESGKGNECNIKSLYCKSLMK